MSKAIYQIRYLQLKFLSALFKQLLVYCIRLMLMNGLPSKQILVIHRLSVFYTYAHYCNEQVYQFS